MSWEWTDHALRKYRVDVQALRRSPLEAREGKLESVVRELPMIGWPWSWELSSCRGEPHTCCRYLLVGRPRDGYVIEAGCHCDIGRIGKSRWTTLGSAGPVATRALPIGEENETLRQYP